MKRISLEVVGYAILFVLVGVLTYDDNWKSLLKAFKGKPYVEVVSNEVTISEFNWGYGSTSVGQFNGDFDKLDEKVFNQLKGKTGTYRVNITSPNIDKYGNANASTEYIGDINADELSKYQDWQYWHKDAGIKSLLLSKYFPIEQPSDVVRNDPTIADRLNANAITYTFTTEELYPNEDERLSLDPHQREIIGDIIDANFDAGAFKIRTSEEDLDIQFNQYSAPSAVLSNLRLALKPGNRINAVCARAGASTLDLVSATITTGSISN